jgi:hypothetical protein
MTADLGACPAVAWRLPALFCDSSEGMGISTVRRIRQRAEAPTLSEAIAAYLATLDHPETAGTRRVYASTLRQLRAYLGPELPVVTLDEPDTATRLAGWLAARWGTRAPATIQPAEKQSDYVEVVLSKLRHDL